jgi:hypothetical protein
MILRAVCFVRETEKYRKTKSFLNQFKTIVVVHALLPIKPISKLDT